MLVFPDSADLADELRELLDARLEEHSGPWRARQRIRDRLEACCPLLSARGTTFMPDIPLSQTIAHFSQPERRRYLSATVGSVDDVQRRLGTPPFAKLTASARPRQGERLVLMAARLRSLHSLRADASSTPAGNRERPGHRVRKRHGLQQHPARWRGRESTSRRAGRSTPPGGRPDASAAGI
jgi:hypothetical protein